MELYNDGWRFLKTQLGTEYGEISGRFEEFESVDIPHDWLIYNVNDLYEDGTGWYIKKFYKSMLKYDESERIILIFDGVYMDSTVYVNGKKVGDWKYGYSTFSFDITDDILEGENTLVVQVRFQSPNSRWYSGAGIYRNVWLHKYPKAHILLDGLYVHSTAEETTQDVSYRISVEAECAGKITEDTCCHFTLWKDSSLVWDLGWQAELRKSGENTIFCCEAVLDGVDEWDFEHPVCYEVRAELCESQRERCIDTQSATVGFRRIKFDPASGLYLNGRSVKLHGVCEHHDLGCLGAAFHKAAMRRKLEMLKRMGANALRTSHNMPAREVMELTDELGILVVSEAFDMWERTKTDYDYGRFFKEWAQRDVRSWIRRDRNHPSLLLWSVGNEIYDTHVDAHGQDIMRRLVKFVRAHDPKENALITIGSNYMPWEGAQKCADIVKIAGYNYGEKYYENHHREHPDWVIYGSETASTVQSRGIYKFPLERSVLADEDRQCSCLGNSNTSWGAENTEACIISDRDTGFSMGQFIWTGFDYIGEPTPYHTKNSYFGQIDTAGFAKDTYYIYQAEWTDAKKAPMVHLFPYWCFNEGQMVDVRACSNASRVELFVNGVSHGIKEIDHKHGKKLLCDWRIPYETGYITAIAYDETGKEIARETRHSFGSGTRLTLTSDQWRLRGNGEDMAFLTVGIVDEQGYPVENAMDYIAVQVTGSGRLMGLDNGDSTDYEPYKGTVRRLFNGKLAIVIGAKAEPGYIDVRVSSPYLESAECRLEVTKDFVRKGLSINEDLCCGDSNALLSEKPVMVRQIALDVPQGTILTKECSSVLLEARILPDNASDTELIWKVVNDKGISIDIASVVEEVCENGRHQARVTALGDGDFVVRCMSRSSTDAVRIISTQDFQASGLGEVFLNPYCFISAGLYTQVIGEIGIGNEKGIATARDGVSGVVFEKVDFGDYGSDEITISIFALSSDAYPIEVWLGMPDEDGSILLVDGIYEKPSIWNVYQEETWTLSQRVKGVAVISIRMRQKVHIKGFCFKHYEKAFCKIDAAECSQIYGDSFKVEEKAVTGIGNNVTIIYENMDFGEQGSSKVVLWGRSPLASNTIHIHFIHEDGEMDTGILEVPGTREYVPQCIELEPLYGKGTLEFIFLPGSAFDLEAFQFEKLC